MGDIPMANNIWVYIDQFKGNPSQASWEAIGLAKSLAHKMGGGVTALVFGSGVEELAKTAFQYGATTAILVDDPSLADFRVEPYAATLAKLASEQKPEVIIGPTSTRVRDTFAMAAVDLGTGVIVDATAVELKDGTLQAVRPVYAGKLLTTVICKEKRPQMITIRPRAFPMPEADRGASGEINKAAPALAEEAVATKVVGYLVEEGEVSVDGAAIIVSGGRGVNGPEGFEPIRNLAKVLGAAVGASRAAVDAGWIPYPHQVGQTGKVVSPDLYIAAGISGAVQHLAGMRTAKVIVAINKDNEAPIFNLAKYGVVGDLFEIVPALTEEFKKRLGK
jgi:electron transfer flavoprotein alpha subunit